MSVRQALRGLVEEVVGPTRPPRPSESSTVERPRRPTPPPEPTPTDEQGSARRTAPQAVPVPMRSRGAQRSEIRAALSSPGGVRQALVLQEILGPPKSLQGFNVDVYEYDVPTSTNATSNLAPHMSRVPSTNSSLERTGTDENFSYTPPPSGSAHRVEPVDRESRAPRRLPSTSASRRSRPGWQWLVSDLVDLVRLSLGGSTSVLRRKKDGSCDGST